MPPAKIKGIWDRFQTADKSGGGVWGEVDHQLANQPNIFTPGVNIWETLNYKPGGVWSQLGDETIVFESSLEGVWSEALDETLILEGGAKDLWREVNDETLILENRRPTEVWRELGEETIILTKPEQNVWEQARGKPGFEELRPIRRLGYALKRFVTAQGEVYYILKNLRQGSYMRLNDRQLFLWNLMDGENTIQDIAVAYMSEFGSLDIGMLVDFLGKLEVNNFLTSKKTNVYDKLDENISNRGPFHWLQKVGSTYMQKEFPLPRMDEFYTKLYNGGIKYLYTKVVLVPLFIITLAGIAAFIYLIIRGEYSLFEGATSSFTLGIVMLYVASMFALFIHEGGHAFTCKHYGRDIRNSGVMIYYGMLAFYVDSTDIWMEPRGPRIMVSFGGPLTGFVLGGIASLAALLSPWQIINGWAYQFAFLIITDSIMNLNPLLKWDGYYILMDFLEIPNLRGRSFNFLSSGKPFKKLLRREKFNREERIFTIYGTLAIFYSVFFLIGALVLFGGKILDFISQFINPVWLIPVIILYILFNLRNQIKSLILALFKRRSRSVKPKDQET
jgi:hypothetical protein